MKILVINSGSSSIKYQLFDMTTEQSLAVGLVERIGEPMSRIKHTVTGNDTITIDDPIADHKRGLSLVVDLMLSSEHGVLSSADEVHAVGHRVVHGGEKIHQPTVLTDDVKATVKQLSSLAPLHNPPNLAGITVAEQIFPQAVQVGVFDTAFHQTLPDYAYRYALPNDLYENHGVRSYGFHGTSHAYVSQQANKYLGNPDAKLITAHLGNGASIAAVRGGKSIDTSMGFTTLPGLIMGTRSGDIDAGIVLFLADKLGMTTAEIDKLLNKQSGLLGLCGDNDLRDITARHHDGDKQASLALMMYAYRIKKYIGSYVVVLGGLDALIFTAGVGENSAEVRQLTCEGLGVLGIELDTTRNQAGKSDGVTPIHAENSRAQVLIIPTNEELEIARQTFAVATNTV